MKLTELEPKWAAIDGRHGTHLSMLCPACREHRIVVPIDPPLDGGPSLEHAWQRTGDAFETVTLRPSILARTPPRCAGWHGFVTGGEVTTC